MSDTRLTLNSITVARQKRLKGGRYIARSTRTIQCRVPLIPNYDGNFVLHINNNHARAKLGGQLIGNTIHMDVDQSVIYELNTPYLKKGFRTIIGYTLNGNTTNLNKRSN